MPNNLTDNEITIKALKELLEVMLSEGDLQRTSTVSHTINLINRLETENKGLRDEIERLHETIEDLQETIMGWDI